jgi:putative endonuclease
MHKSYSVYINTNRNKTTLYVGVTSNLQRRISEHQMDSENAKQSFAGKYNCYFLVYYEVFNEPKKAIEREKKIKKWRREKKNALIAEFNPEWDFLNEGIF